MCRKDATCCGPPPYVGGYMFMFEKGMGFDNHNS
jgi:hypothetical protein